MAITVEERNISQQGGDKRYTGYYLIKGTASFTDARSELLSSIPLVEGSLIYQDCQLEPQYVDTLNPDKCIWYAEAQYGELGSQSPAKKMEIGDIRIQFDTTGGQVHITSSREVVGAFDDAEVSKVIGLGENEMPVYVMPVGSMTKPCNCKKDKQKKK